MSVDQRKFPRVNYPCSITVWRDDGSTDVIMANTANISAGGICVYLSETVALESFLEIKIENFFEGNPLRCKGTVVRSQPDKANQNNQQKYFEIGIKFLEMDQSQHEYLAGFVERLMALETKKG